LDGTQTQSVSPNTPDQGLVNVAAAAALAAADRTATVRTSYNPNLSPLFSRNRLPSRTYCRTIRTLVAPGTIGSLKNTEDSTPEFGAAANSGVTRFLSRITS
jgi:hypothetical protein